MSESLVVSGISKKEKYESLLPQLKALVAGETDLIANTSNITAVLKYGMDFFWVGVYFVKASPHPRPYRNGTFGRVQAPFQRNGEQELVLGPFQGPVACTRIAFGKGVCGAAWKEKRTLVVPDVEKFPGHISCNANSKSEIVVPCIKNGEVLALLDVDSYTENDFDEIDKKYLEEIAHIIAGLHHV